MNLCNLNHDFNYETEKLCRIFLPFEKINILKAPEKSEIYAVTELNGNCASAEVHFGEKCSKHTAKATCIDDECFKKAAERAIAGSLYKCFTDLTGYVPQWGILTGVRPAKLYSSLIRKYGENGAKKYFSEQLFVSNKKAELCTITAKTERKIIEKSTPDSFSLYISIPFCPSRCAYCSFVSHSVEKAKKLIPLYVEKLKEEIALSADIAESIGLKLKTVYIGGGTPTTLSAEQLTDLTNTIRDEFDLSEILEYTVEAGRPDTLTEDKLKAILNCGATRISINPQTMNDSVLNAVGRRHTAEDTVNAFNLARKTGFNNINMDLIAGLPSDTLESFKKSVDEIIKLNPENVTVHSLSLKRASTFNKNGEFPEIEQGMIASDMVDYAKSALTNAGINPYYMYRQSKTVGNLENVGYAKSGYEGCYNVYIMDETHTIFACGAAGVTKLRSPNGSYIERIFNYKYPYEYINDFETIKKRKQGIISFYKKYMLDIIE